MAARSRPLSPHLQVYKFTLTMASSIIHRGTGMAMYFGTLLIVLWVGAAALGDGPLAVVNAIYGFWLVQVIFFLATWALFQHLFGGIGAAARRRRRQCSQCIRSIDGGLIRCW